MKIKSQWELWEEIDKNNDFPQDHWEDKWVGVEELLYELENDFWMTRDDFISRLKGKKKWKK